MIANRNLKYFILYLPIMLVMWSVIFPSCKEIGPDIDLSDTVRDTALMDTTYFIVDIPAAQSKIVLMEEFTGVRCINCPDGHLQIELIQNTHPGRVAAVALHSDFLGVAYPGQPELRIPEAQNLEDLLGPAAAKPMAAIDRILFSGESTELIFLQQWAARVNQQLNEPVRMNLSLESRIENNDLIVKITVMFLHNNNADLRLTLLLTENNVEVPQLTNSGVDSTYSHQHVARAFLTRYNGNNLGYLGETGRVVVKEFRYSNIAGAGWKLADMKLVAFIHESGAGKRVFQTVERSVTP